MAGRYRKATYDLEKLMLYDREKTLALVRNLGGPEYCNIDLLVGIEHWIDSMDYNAYRKVRDKVAKELKKVTSHPTGMTAGEEREIIALFEYLLGDNPFYFYKLFGLLEILSQSHWSWRNRIIRNMVKIKSLSLESYENVMEMAKEKIKEQETKDNSPSNIIPLPKVQNI